MVKKQSRMLLITAVITSLSLYLAPAFAATPGTWTGMAEFGTFDLVVNSGGTGIEKISYSFSDWTCGPATMNGGVGITPGTPWPIINDEFSLTTSLDPDKAITVSGVFNSASQASGDWDAVIHGVDCSGPWDTSGENEIEVELTVDHAYVKGVYVNPDELPGWGFFADVQEENFFGAIYGYLSGDSTFITLQGLMTSNDPPRYQGNVYFISNNGTAATDVGNFTWATTDHEAAPAALLTLTSNILNVTNLGLARFSYAEIDKVDMLTGGDWNITRRLADSTFGDYYAIDDMRMVVDGITYAGVVDNWNPDLEGLVGYFPDPGGDFYGMLVEFDSVSDVFYIFIGNDTDMYGRYWFLEADEEPSDGGDHFRGAADSMQVPDTRDSANGAKSHSAVEKAETENFGANLEPMFTKSRIQSAYQNLRRVNKP